MKWLVWWLVMVLLYGPFILPPLKPSKPKPRKVRCVLLDVAQTKHGPLGLLKCEDGKHYVVPLRKR